MDTSELRKAAKAVFLAVEEHVAKELSEKLNAAADEIDRLRAAAEVKYEGKTLTDCVNEAVQENESLPAALAEVAMICYEGREQQERFRLIFGATLVAWFEKTNTAYKGWAE